MSNLGHEHDLGVWVGAIGLLTGWCREAWRWLASLRKKADASEIEERRVMIEEFRAFREAYHEDKQEMLEKIARSKPVSKTPKPAQPDLKTSSPKERSNTKTR